MWLRIHAEGNVPQGSIAERKSNEEDDLRSHKLILKSPIMTSSREFWDCFQKLIKNLKQRGNRPTSRPVYTTNNQRRS